MSVARLADMMMGAFAATVSPLPRVTVVCFHWMALFMTVHSLPAWAAMKSGTGQQRKVNIFGFSFFSVSDKIFFFSCFVCGFQ
jgi:hypothetical protein